MAISSSLLISVSSVSPPPWSTPRTVACLSLLCRSMRSSTVPRHTSLCTSTFLCWPMRYARSVAWSSTAGFHQRTRDEIRASTAGHHSRPPHDRCNRRVGSGRTAVHDSGRKECARPRAEGQPAGADRDTDGGRARVHRSETDMTKRVLIVDDEPIVIALLRDCFAFKVGFPQPVRGSSASGACFAASKPARNSKNSDRELLRPAFAKTASDARSDDPRSCDVPRLSRHVRRFSRLAKRAALAIREVSALRVYPRRIHAMTREQPKAIPNWCL